MTYTLDEVLAEPTTLQHRVLDDGRVLIVRRIIIGVELSISTPEHLAMGFKTDMWEYGVGSDLGYTSLGDALGHATNALLDWDGDGEPERWTRHAPTGRRRPQGDPDREYVRH